MAFTGDLGRVQGASTFHTMTTSSTSISVSSLQSQLTPFVGDAVLFPNGDVRQITGVSSSTITLGDVLFSVKGDPGIGNATLSNVDGDSMEDGATQAAIKGVLQAKNYYNLGAYDTYVSNGDGTGTVTRKIVCITKSDISNYGSNSGSFPYSGIFMFSNKLSFVESLDGVKCNKQNINFYGLNKNDDGYNVSFSIQKDFNSMEELEEFLSDIVIQFKSKYQYTEKVIENQPIRFLPLDGELKLYEEWRKGLNLYKGQDIIGSPHNQSIGIYSAGTYTIAVIASEKTGLFIINSDGSHTDFPSLEINGVQTFTLTKTEELGVYNNADTKIMLTRGSHPYPYEPYNGGIIHEKDLSGIQLFPEGVNPAQTIGGDWEDKGTVTTSDNTVFHAYRRLS